MNRQINTETSQKELINQREMQILWNLQKKTNINIGYYIWSGKSKSLEG